MRSGSSAVAETLDLGTTLREHDRWLRTIVYSRVGQADAVDDVMQEVALAASRPAALPPDAAKIAPWLYRVAVRQSLLYRRKCGRRRKLNDNLVRQRPPAEHDDTTPNPLEWLLAEERARMLRTALARLTRRDREILLLKYVENWTYQEIADHLGTTDTAVEARLHRARQRLRTAMTTIDANGGLP